MHNEYKKTSCTITCGARFLFAKLTDLLASVIFKLLACANKLGEEMTEKELVNKWLAFHNLEKMISSELEAILGQGQHPMTLNEFYSLYYLNETEGNDLRLSDLAEKICLSLSATSRMLARFEDKCGVIERHISTKDKREVKIKLTPEGKERLRNASAKIAKVMANYEKQM